MPGCISEGSGQHTESRELLFINRYSVDQDRKAHGPDRQTISTHVQRIIRQEKRMAARESLRTTIPGGKQSRRDSNYTADAGARLSPHQCSTSEQRDLQCGCFYARSRLLAQTVSTSSDQTPDFSSRQALELKLEKTSTLLETMQMHLSKIPEPLPGASSLNIRALSTSKTAKTLLSFCESSYSLHVFRTLSLRASQYDGIDQLKSRKNLNTAPRGIPQLTRMAVLETFIPRNFVFPIQAQEHAQWVVQSALASSELLFAILALSGASLLTLTRSPASSTDTEEPHGLISSHDVVAFKVVAVQLLRSSIENNSEPGWDCLLYTIMCLMDTEVRLPTFALEITILSCLEDN